eukprot:TRINITY_DN778_c0_g1_i1.p1 TRINITY_DN778_c0_g1~~TRINITY_DN778_c0_g1_i1.p1  ORF type:complete len:101 (+),score=28.37 TRINITY_DN778_c0_g1_i1:130-432(+)
MSQPEQFPKEVVEEVQAKIRNLSKHPVDLRNQPVREVFRWTLNNFPSFSISRVVNWYRREYVYPGRGTPILHTFALVATLAIGRHYRKHYPSAEKYEHWF